MIWYVETGILNSLYYLYYSLGELLIHPSKSGLQNVNKKAGKPVPLIILKYVGY